MHEKYLLPESSLKPGNQPISQGSWLSSMVTTSPPSDDWRTKPNWVGFESEGSAEVLICFEMGSSWGVAVVCFWKKLHYSWGEFFVTFCIIFLLPGNFLPSTKGFWTKNMVWKKGRMTPAHQKRVLETAFRNHVFLFMGLVHASKNGWLSFMWFHAGTPFGVAGGEGVTLESCAERSTGKFCPQIQHARRLPTNSDPSPLSLPPRPHFLRGEPNITWRAQAV